MWNYTVTQDGRIHGGLSEIRTLIMKIFFSASMLLVVFLCAGLLSAQENKGPKIEIKELQHDFGKVVQGTQASHVFEVRNAGGEPLIIERVQST